MTDTHESKSVYGYSKRELFLLICLVTLVLLYIKKSMIEDATAAFEFLADQPQSSALYMRSALQYLSIPFIYAWKFTALGFVIWVGCFLFGYRVTYAECWKIVLVGEFIFMVPEVLKILWFFFVERDPNFYDIRAFYPLSVMNFLDYRTLSPEYSYPCKAMSVWEPIYWYLLVLGTTHYTRRGTRPAWIIVLGFYVPVFLLWLLFYILVY